MLQQASAVRAVLNPPLKQHVSEEQPVPAGGGHTIVSDSGIQAQGWCRTPSIPLQPAKQLGMQKPHFRIVACRPGRGQRVMNPETTTRANPQLTGAQARCHPLSVLATLTPQTLPRCERSADGGNSCLSVGTEGTQQRTLGSHTLSALVNCIHRCCLLCTNSLQTQARKCYREDHAAVKKRPATNL